MGYRAVIFDLGGVVFPSPFEAFDAYEHDVGLPTGSIRALIRVSSETGAWAALERAELSLPDFHHALEEEARLAGFAIESEALMQRVAAGFGPRPAMLRAVERIREAGLATAALTNNWVATGDRHIVGAIGGEARFDVVVESSVEGMRKPDPRIYQLVIERLGVEASETVFLDDLGINLKPARALGMTTIKVSDPTDALRELEQVLGFGLG
jgi:putative hydrolase of the HAD superfamily